MKNYVYIYSAEGPRQPPAPEAMEAWNTWFSSLSERVVDGGSPLVGEKVVLKNGGVTYEDDDLIGYTVVKAKSMDEAVDMAKGCPLASASGASVRVYEAVEM